MSRTEMNNHFHFLKNAYFFQNLDDATIKKILAVCQEKTYESGRVIFEEGDKAERFSSSWKGKWRSGRTTKTRNRTCWPCTARGISSVRWPS